jgi:ADP-ribose pyrophosphatase
VSRDEPTLEWRTVETAELHTNRIFRIERRTMQRVAEPGRAPAEFFVIDSPSWVNVIALTDRDELVLVEQWRHAVDHPTIEIPGGGIDLDEPPLEAAKRELREETGYASDRWSELGNIEPNPAIHKNRCYTFLAEGCEKRGEPAFDENENCRVTLIPFDAYEAMIARGEVTHALVVVAMYFERLRRIRAGR